MIKLSVAIITFNEESNIKRCLESVRDIADEILVVDSFSTDATEAICRSTEGVRFIQNRFLGHIEQKNFAIDQTSHPFVLSLDADEALDDLLREQVRKAKANFLADGYYINRLTRYRNHWVRHCGWYPDWKLRLVRKAKARWGGYNPHDILQLERGALSARLPGTLLHYSYPTIADHVRQTNQFTTIAAQAAYDRGVRSNMFKIVTRPVLKFLRDYVFKLGFLDGRYGLIICSINALSALLKYSKLKELQDENRVST